MGSLYKGVDLFGSGPHRIYVGRKSRRVISLAALTGDVSVAGTIESGDYELRVEVRGRLIADDDVGLWALRDAISGEADSSVESGILEDGRGRQWDTMKLLSYEESGGVGRGRKLSVGYVAEFGVLSTG